MLTAPCLRALTTSQKLTSFHFFKFYQGITVMRPHFGNSGDAWVLQKEEQNIIPANLKTRDLVKYPQRY